MRYSLSFVLAAVVTLLPATLPAQQMITGPSAFADWNREQPGVLLNHSRRSSRAEAGRGSKQHTAHGHPAPRPDAWPIAPDGFKK